MAPEQTRPDAREIGPWTDTYLLGGCLYFLLTGYLPHQGDTSQKVYFEASMGIVRPPAQVAADRELPPELVAIAMAALEREIGSRTPSAAVFVAQLQDYLSGASRRRESQARVHEAQVRLPGAKDYHTYAELLALLGQAAALWNGNPEVAPLRERVLREYAESALHQGDLVLASANAEQLAETGGRESLRERIRRAAEAHRRQRQQRRALLWAAFLLAAAIITGGTFFQLRISAQRDAMRESREAADAMVGFMLNDLTKRLAAVDPKLELLRPIADEAMRYYREQPYASLPASEVERLLAGMEVVAGVYEKQGNREAAVAVYAEGERAAEAWMRQNGYDSKLDMRRLMNGTGRVRIFVEASESNAAVPELERLLGELRNFPKGEDPRAEALTGALLGSLAIVEERRGNYDRALELMRECINRYQIQADRRPDDPLVRAEFATRLNHYGFLLQSKGNGAEAERAFTRAYEIYEKLYRNKPVSPEVPRFLAVALLTLSDIRRDRGDVQGAAEFLARSRMLLLEALRLNPGDQVAKRTLGDVLARIAYNERLRGNVAEAIKHLDSATALLKGIFELYPKDRQLGVKYALTQQKRSVLLMDLERNAEAVASAKAALEVLERSIDGARPTTEELEARRDILQQLGVSYLRAERPADAVAVLGEHVALLRRAAVASPNDPHLHSSLAVGIGVYGMAQMAARRSEEALPLLLEGEELCRQALARWEATAERLRDLAVARSRLADLAWDMGRLDDSAQGYESTIEAYDRALAGAPRAAMLAHERGLMAMRLARVQEARGDRAAAQAAIDIAEAAFGTGNISENTFLAVQSALLFLRRAHAHLEAEEPEAALAAAEDGIALCRAMDDGTSDTAAALASPRLALLFLIASESLRSGGTDRAQECLDAMDAMVGSLPEAERAAVRGRHQTLRLETLRIGIAQARGNDAAARADCDRTRELATELGATFREGGYFQLAEAAEIALFHERCGDLEMARRWLRGVLDRGGRRADWLAAAKRLGLETPP